MNWDQPAFSFGTPNAEPPTPTKTPTPGNLASPILQTPQNKPASFEERGGWTPTFAEEYSVFNSTPGRLISDNPPFGDFNTPRPLASPIFSRKLPNANVVAEEPSIHAQHPKTDISSSIPSIVPSQHLVSSSKPYTSTTTAGSINTPTRAAIYSNDPVSAQTATPPASRSKGTRKLAPKLSSSTMQNDHQDGHFDFSQTPTHGSHMMDFPTTTADFMSYPLSAPATAPVFGDGKTFWDVDQSMSGMDLDFSSGTMNMFETHSHKAANSLDWGRNNEVFQQEVNNIAGVTQPALSKNSTNGESSSKRARPLAPKVDLSDLLKTTPALTAFDVNSPSQMHVQGTKHVELSVDPASLWSRPSLTSPTVMAPPLQKTSSISPVRPASSEPRLQPYSQQIRESMRDQQEHQDLQAERVRARQRSERAARSSPVRGFARPGLHRSMSESKARRTQDRPVSRPTGRASPVKRIAGLSSIPETSTSMRTEVKFVIDKNGRASTETVIINDRPRSFYDNGDSQSDTSDDELPGVLSRNTSFSLPRPIAAKVDCSEISSRGSNSHRHVAQRSYSNSESSRSSQRRGSLDSEAETVMEHDSTGDASQEIRKMMQARKHSQHRVSSAPLPRNPTDLRPRPSYYASSSNVSPSHTDLSGATPSSTRSGTTRCVCKSGDNEGFMIQCESCDCWLHTACVGIDQYSLPPVYICAFCAQTPNKRGPRVRDMTRGANSGSGISPLAHKSFQSFR